MVPLFVRSVFTTCLLVCSSFCNAQFFRIYPWDVLHINNNRSLVLSNRVAQMTSYNGGNYDKPWYVCTFDTTGNPVELRYGAATSPEWNGLDGTKDELLFRGNWAECWRLDYDLQGRLDHFLQVQWSRHNRSEQETWISYDDQSRPIQQIDRSWEIYRTGFIFHRWRTSYATMTRYSFAYDDEGEVMCIRRGADQAAPDTVFSDRPFEQAFGTLDEVIAKDTIITYPQTCGNAHGLEGPIVLYCGDSLRDVFEDGRYVRKYFISRSGEVRLVQSYHYRDDGLLDSFSDGAGRREVWLEYLRW
jgi:hypothetical protein